VPNPTGTPTRRGDTPDAPLNRFERALLFVARVLLERLRSCDLCHKSNEQEYFLQYSDGYEVHVDCGAEYNDACSVDPTTQYLGETDEEWEARCRSLGFGEDYMYTCDCGESPCVKFKDEPCSSIGSPW